MYSKGRSILVLLLSVTVAQLTGLVGSFATRPNIETWYRTLDKPAFTPPDWIFPVVWPSLYLLMGIAAWLVYRTPERKSRAFWGEGSSYESMLLPSRPSRRTALSVYGIHLVFNAAWSFIFFEWQLTGLAFIEIIILLSLILWTTRLFYRIRPLAGYLMVPYIIWVSYATILNGAIWWLNR